MRLITMIFLLCIAAGWSSAHAGTCTTITPQESTLSIGTITVQRDVAVGTVLFSRNASITSAYLTGCTSPVMLGFSMRYLNATQSAFGNHVYDTNVSGIGIRFSSGGYFENPTNTFSYTAQASYVEWWGGKIELIVTGPVASGSLTPGVLGVVMLQGSDGIYRDALTTTLLGGTVNVLACSITTPQLTFPIGDISAATFGSTVGITPAGARNTQNLGLNSDPGANVNVSISGIQNPDVATTSVLALTGQGNTGTAKGVGVQLLYNGTPLALNTRLPLTVAAGGQQTFPLTARYYQTKTTVEPGTANASATLNLTYQ